MPSSLPANLGKLGVEVLMAARRWGRSRALMRSMLDSKSASQSDVTKVKKAYDKTNTDLEIAVRILEKSIRDSGHVTSMSPLTKPSQFPWKELMGFVSHVAKAVDTAADPARETTVIDATPPNRK